MQATVMDKKTARTILNRMIKRYGEVTPDLIYEDLYQLAIAVVLSAQTTDNQVNTVTPKLFSLYPDFKSLAAAEIPDVEQIVKSTGFYRNKAKNIVTLARIVMKYFNGILPSDIDTLMELPGVG
jgi:endonuclease-3